MNAYMIYNPEEAKYLAVRGLWSWASQEFSVIFKDLQEVEDIIETALESRGWKLERHTFKLERVL